MRQLITRAEDINNSGITASFATRLQAVTDYPQAITKNTGNRAAL